MNSMKKFKQVIFILIGLNISSMIICSRNIYQRSYQPIPSITTYWKNNPQGKNYTLNSRCLEDWAIFGRFNKEFLLKHQLPEKVPYRYSNKTVSREELKQEIEKIIDQVKSKNKPGKINNAVIFKDRDFNYRTQSGLLIVKLEKFPFVIKIFKENPKTFVKPYSKGFVPCTWFMMGGGISRYLAGFTRIPNLIKIKTDIRKSKAWSHKITTPNKWFGIPNNAPWFVVEGKNMGKKRSHKIEYPSVYYLVCDHMEIERPLHLTNKKDRQDGIEISKLLGNKIDPHLPNFGIEKGTDKYVIIDTEHLASAVGLRKPMKFNSYFDYYGTLIKKAVHDIFFTTKKERLALQQQPLPHNLKLDVEDAAYIDEVHDQ